MHRFDRDIARLRQVSDEGRRRLCDLRRGLELARAQDAQPGRSVGQAGGGERQRRVACGRRHPGADPRVPCRLA